MYNEETAFCRNISSFRGAYSIALNWKSNFMPDYYGTKEENSQLLMQLTTVRDSNMAWILTHAISAQNSILSLSLFLLKLLIILGNNCGVNERLDRVAYFWCALCLWKEFNCTAQTHPGIKISSLGPCFRLHPKYDELSAEGNKSPPL